MKKNNTEKKILHLSTQTVRALADADLKPVAGAGTGYTLCCYTNDAQGWSCACRI